MVAGANVLGVACDVGEFTTSNNCDAQIVAPLLNWLADNPSKRPQYVILFYGIPTRLTNMCPCYDSYGSISYHLQQSYPNWQPFVNNINASNVVDCMAYVDKIASIGSNYCPGKLVVSAGSSGIYGNTSFYLDNIRYKYPRDYTLYGWVVSNAISSLMYSGIPTNAVTYMDGVEATSTLSHITVGVNVAGYICWGEHSSLGWNYSIDGAVKWGGNSSWWVIETIESFNGQVQQNSLQGNFPLWFSSGAFGGTNYSCTPVGAVTHTEEPGIYGVESSPTYFGLWASGKNFAICAWASRNTQYFQAIGDPFVAK